MKQFTRSTEVRLALVILGTAVLPLMTAVWLANAMFRSSSQVWTRTEVGPQLNRGVEIYKDYVKSVKDDIRHQSRTVGLELEQLGARRTSQTSALQLKADLDLLLEETPGAIAFAVFDHDENLIGETHTTRVIDPVTDRSLETIVPLRDGRSLQTKFTTSKKKLDELETAGRVASEFHQLEQLRGEIYQGYSRSFALLLGLTILVTALVGYSLARGITKRIRRLQRAAKIVATGDLTVQVPVTGSDELTDLAAGFNSMVREIDRSRGRIEFLQRMSAWQEMAQRLAHEIKNPLTPIQLSVQECQRQYKGDDAGFGALLSKTVTVVEEEVGALRRLVGNFSNFARLPESELTRSDVRSYLAELPAQIDGEVRAAGNAQWELGSEAIYANFDKQLLRRVLVNLVQNAWDACAASKEARVHVSLTRTAENVVISVEDSGAGVESADQTRIFEPYVTRKAEGTGLGLAIVKKIIVEHEGQITIEKSESLGGAKFVLRLPLAATP
jgi:two-component system, NtrC family, nitrogen regulation sensor histidine kinase NtrY